MKYWSKHSAGPLKEMTKGGIGRMYQGQACLLSSRLRASAKTEPGRRDTVFLTLYYLVVRLHSAILILFIHLFLIHGTKY